MSDADRCICCGEVIPEGVQVCPKCLTSIEPPAKFKQGDIVKMTLKDKGYAYYNHVVDSYYNHEISMRLYRLNEQMAMPVYREDWLELVSDAEISHINKSGLLRSRRRGGFEHPIMEGVNK